MRLPLVFMTNILFIVCDTLRKDIMDLYGGQARMPHLRRLAADSVTYENAVSPSPWTFPSHVSMFTGMYPSEHGIHETKTIKLPDLTELHSKFDAQRIAERLSSAGYTTMGISNNLMVSRFTGFDRGFSSFFNTEPSPWSQSDIATTARQLGADPIDVARELLKAGRLKEIYRLGREFLRIRALASATNYPLNKGSELTNSILFHSSLKSDFFVFINLWEMHEPYRGFEEKETVDNFAGVRQLPGGKVDYLKRQYVLEAEYLDRSLGALFGMLKRRNLYDDTAIILTSDHGQAFNEHGFMYHGIYLYDEISRVPLIVKYPGNRRPRPRSGYQSIVSLHGLLERLSEGQRDDEGLTTDSAFAESYGNTQDLPKSHSSRRHYVEKKYEKVRKAVYMDGYKLTVNSTDASVEEFMKGGGPASLSRAADRRKARELLEELGRFKGKEKFNLPDV